jgi:hypothetical protein
MSLQCRASCLDEYQASSEWRYHSDYWQVSSNRNCRTALIWINLLEGSIDQGI